MTTKLGGSRTAAVQRRSAIRLAAGISGALLVIGLPSPALGHHDIFVDKLPFGTTERVSVSSTGEPPNGPSGGGYTSVGVGQCSGGGHDYGASDNGRYVTFASAAGNLHPADINGKTIVDVFLYDRKTDDLDLLSKLPTGLSFRPPASAPVTDCTLQNHSPVISGNGRFAAFVSNLPLLGIVDPDAPAVISDSTTLLVHQVYLYDAKKDTLEIVSKTWDGSQPSFTAAAIEDESIGSGLKGIAINNNGRFVAFTSEAANITENSCSDDASGAAAGSANCSQVYVRDRKKKTTTVVSMSSTGAVSDAPSWYPSMSGNGHQVAFESAADNLVQGDVNQCLVLGMSPPGCPDVFLHDLSTKQTELISVSRNGSSGNDFSSGSRWFSSTNTISSDGRLVVFSSYATDLVPATPDAPRLVGPSASYLRDRKTGRTERISVNSAGMPMRDDGIYPSITDDGRYVMDQMSDPFSLCPTECDHTLRGTFVHDRRTGQADRVGAFIYHPMDDSVDPPGTHIFAAHIGGDGSFFLGIAGEAFDKEDTNSATDVFIRTFFARGLAAGALRTSDGSTTASSPSHQTDMGDPPVISFRDDASDVGVPNLGGEIVGVSVAERPALDDLFVRIDVERIADLHVPALYGLRFDLDGITYEARAQGLGGPLHLGGGTFALFRCQDAACARIASLGGGYGTVGENVVMRVPLAVLGAHGGQIDNVQAYSALGTIGLDQDEHFVLDVAS